MIMFAKSTKVLVATLVLAAASLSFAANAAPRPNQGGWQGGESYMQESSARTSYQGYDPPWTFACIKDHGTSRCNDLN
jgi:uncharacterized protein YdeI (BOF family)